MSREAGRVRALVNAARLQFLLESRDRIELLGLAIAKEAPGPADAARQAAAPGARHQAVGRGRFGLDA